MKIICLLLLILCLNGSEQGIYSFSAHEYFESVELLKDNRFIYKRSFNFSQYETKGSYHILNDTLILNSYPQKERIMVKEERKGNLKNVTFEVTRKDGWPLFYHLYVILVNGEELAIREQYKKTKLKNVQVKGFYIVDGNGMTSPKYMIIGKTTNHYKVLFESSRVFENEKWAIKGDSILPLGFDGKAETYKLIKG